MLPGSLGVIDGAMISLREVGPLGFEDLQTIAMASAEWNIQSLHAVLHSAPALNYLVETRTTPHLEFLTIEGAMLSSASEYVLQRLATSWWWHHLVKLTRIDELEAAASWLALKLEPIPWLAIAERGEHGGAAGWELAYSAGERRLGVRLLGFTPTSTRTRLGEILDRLPDCRVELHRTTWWQPTSDDVTTLGRTGRDVTLG